MSQAEELLNSLSAKGAIAVQTTNTATEGFIIVDDNRFITVPDELKRIAVANDHNIESVTFECPRWWDNHDLYDMQFYINYRSPDGTLGCYPINYLATDPLIPHILRFTWTITRNVAKAKGKVVFLVCAKKVDKNGNEVLHWNSELCEDMYVSEGLECEAALEEEYPDLYMQLINYMDESKKDIHDSIGAAEENFKSMRSEIQGIVGSGINDLDEIKEEVAADKADIERIAENLAKANKGGGVVYSPNVYFHTAGTGENTVDIFSSESEVTKFLDYNGTVIDKENLIDPLLNEAECSVWIMSNFCRILYRIPLNYEHFQSIFLEALKKYRDSIEIAKNVLVDFIIRTIYFDVSSLSSEGGIGCHITPTHESVKNGGIVHASYDFIETSYDTDTREYNYKFLGKVSVPATMRYVSKLNSRDRLLISLQDIGNFMTNPNYLYPNSDDKNVYFPSYFTLDMTFPCKEVGRVVNISDLVGNYIEINATEFGTQNNTMHSKSDAIDS